MIDRGHDRRWRPRTSGMPLPERRDGFDRRETRSQPTPPSAIRLGHGEAAPRIERRRFPDTGMD